MHSVEFQTDHPIICLEAWLYFLAQAERSVQKCSIGKFENETHAKFEVVLILKQEGIKLRSTPHSEQSGIPICYPRHKRNTEQIFTIPCKTKENILEHLCNVIYVGKQPSKETQLDVYLSKVKSFSCHLIMLLIKPTIKMCNEHLQNHCT